MTLHACCTHVQGISRQEPRYRAAPGRYRRWGIGHRRRWADRVARGAGLDLGTEMFDVGLVEHESDEARHSSFCSSTVRHSGGILTIP
jgi:hypothetical protein